MTFKSPLLLALILLFAAAYFWLARRRKGEVLAPAALLLFSAGIYAPWGLGPLGLVLAQAAGNCACALRLARREQGGRGLLAASVAANVLFLAACKYAEPLAALTGWRIPAPPGISFLTFIQVALLADAALGRARPAGWLQAMQFSLFFPAMLSGPISRYADVGERLAGPQARRFSWENAGGALYLFGLGLFKKIMLADSLAPVANQGYALAGGLEFYTAWASTLAYTLQIYFDFSGYSDMAIAAASLFGAPLPDNFLSPYKALNIQDFWRRWHMTLGLFMRDYVYIPLGGGRHGLARKCLALSAVFLLVGAWHGAGWTFIIWGAMHGGAMVIHACWRARGLRLPGWLGWLLTFLFVHCAWVFFRAPDAATALSVLRALAGFSGAAPQALREAFSVPWTTLALMPALLALCLALRNSLELARALRPGWTGAATAAGALALGLLFAGGGPQFLYFQF